jgi:predicted Zn-dependent protease
VGDEVNTAHLDEAIAVLERANALDENNTAGWQLLAMAYGRQGRIGRDKLNVHSYSLFQPA